MVEYECIKDGKEVVMEKEHITIKGIEPYDGKYEVEHKDTDIYTTTMSLTKKE